MINNTYLDPKISKLNNVVIIERSDKMRYNATLGFSWTPYKYWVDKMDAAGEVVSHDLVTKGPTFAVFVNPVSLSTISETNKPFDWGVGAGWRFRAVSLLATIEFLNVRQPRDYFLAQFEGKNLPLIVNGNIQSEISTSDDTLFKNRGVAAIGLKLVIPIDLLNFGKNSGTNGNTTSGK
ncbi:hypothetical protein N180_05180 [Pedobacter antarcticus 4BY]|uniref:Uncharacterized protein n=2 Tax=Pedobacter antarcticus TaxID=34086 RepID=A0A081PIU3_9SPHI|nr:hypothetical protein N180_05180 [Pedobacter antarcticus 4BY]